jgi:hypothetical protein
MIIITLWVVEKRIQEVQLGRGLEAFAKEADRSLEQGKQEWERMEREARENYQPLTIPQPSKRSSEWGSGR